MMTHADCKVLFKLTGVYFGLIAVCYIAVFGTVAVADAIKDAKKLKKKKELLYERLNRAFQKNGLVYPRENFEKDWKNFKNKKALLYV